MLFVILAFAARVGQLQGQVRMNRGNPDFSRRSSEKSGRWGIHSIMTSTGFAWKTEPAGSEDGRTGKKYGNGIE
jgi:hypothetical protein